MHTGWWLRARDERGCVNFRKNGRPKFKSLDTTFFIPLPPIGKCFKVSFESSLLLKYCWLCSNGIATSASAPKNFWGHNQLSRRFQSWIAEVGKQKSDFLPSNFCNLEFDWITDMSTLRIWEIWCIVSVVVEVSEPVGNCSIFDVKVFEDEKGDAAKSDLSVVRLAIYCCDRVKVNRGDKRDPFVDKKQEGDI